MDVLLKCPQLESLFLSSEMFGICILSTREDHSSSLSILAEEYLLLHFFEVVLVGKFLVIFLTTRMDTIIKALHFYSSASLVVKQVRLRNKWQLRTGARIIIRVVTVGLVILCGITRV